MCGSSFTGAVSPIVDRLNQYVKLYGPGTYDLTNPPPAGASAAAGTAPGSSAGTITSPAAAAAIKARSPAQGSGDSFAGAPLLTPAFSPGSAQLKTLTGM